MTRKVPLFATLLVAAAIAAMIALGVWQLQRARWKEALLAHYSEAQAMSAAVPWPRGEAAIEQSLFRWSGFDCQRVLGLRVTAATSAKGQSGVAQIARCALPDGSEAEVALGWSLAPQVPSWQGGEVSGIIGPRGVLIAAQPAAGLQSLAPPDPVDAAPPTPEGHLAYAGQWFFFALTALVIYILALRKRWRNQA